MWGYGFNPHALHSALSNPFDSFTEDRFEYQQLHENNLKNCSSERQKAKKSGLNVQPQIPDFNYCLGATSSAMSCLSTTRNLVAGTYFLLREPNAINTQLKHRTQMVGQSCKTGYSVSWCQENDTALTYQRSQWNSGL